MNERVSLFDFGLYQMTEKASRIRDNFDLLTGSASYDWDKNRIRIIFLGPREESNNIDNMNDFLDLDRKVQRGIGTY